MVDEVSSNPIPKGKLPPALELLRNLERWVIWRWQNGENGERTKPLYQARYPDKYAENNNVHTWATYDEAVAAAAKDDTIAGVGLVLTGSNLVAFDIDDCRDDKTGKIHAWAKDLIERAGSYAEVTVSGTGVRIIGHGTGPKPNRTKLPVPKSKGMTCEFYRKAVRYITMTGNQIGEPKR
jgi:primase-polymerase (primpol)-like protein